MPPIAYDVENNVLFKALRRKAKEQLRGIPDHYLRCIFLFDVGCSLLKRLKPLGGQHEVSGERIINHALKRLNIVIICVFSVQRDQPVYLGTQKRPYWKVTTFDHRHNVPSSEYQNLQFLASRFSRREICSFSRSSRPIIKAVNHPRVIASSTSWDAGANCSIGCARPGSSWSG